MRDGASTANGERSGACMTDARERGRPWRNCMSACRGMAGHPLQGTRTAAGGGLRQPAFLGPNPAPGNPGHSTGSDQVPVAGAAAPLTAQQRDIPHGLSAFGARIAPAPSAPPPDPESNGSKTTAGQSRNLCSVLTVLHRGLAAPSTHRILPVSRPADKTPLSGSRSVPRARGPVDRFCLYCRAPLLQSGGSTKPPVRFCGRRPDLGIARARRNGARD